MMTQCKLKTHPKPKEYPSYPHASGRMGATANLMMMSQGHWGSHDDVIMESLTLMISRMLRFSTTRT